MRIRSVLKHSTQAVLEGALIASLVVGLMAGTALAGKPGGGGGGGHGKPGGGGTATGGLTLVMVADANGNRAPNWNDTITFSVTSINDAPVGTEGQARRPRLVAPRSLRLRVPTAVRVGTRSRG